MDNNRLIELLTAMREDAMKLNGKEHPEVLTLNTVLQILTDEEFATSLYGYYFKKNNAERGEAQ